VSGQIAGTGIGLATARQVVEQHGGDIRVDSEEGQGSTFTVRLPLAPDAGRPLDEPVPRLVDEPAHHETGAGQRAGLALESGLP
jgi:hypothetical protein